MMKPQDLNASEANNDLTSAYFVTALSTAYRYFYDVYIRQHQQTACRYLPRGYFLASARQ
eukprot:scaffold288384_cov18-Prasinocladus_malaysianus.AAC.2